MYLFIHLELLNDSVSGLHKNMTQLRCLIIDMDDFFASYSGHKFDITEHNLTLNYGHYSVASMCNVKI